MNVLRAIVDHSLGEATELEASAAKKEAEAELERARALTIRNVYALAVQWESPSILEPERGP